MKILHPFRTALVATLGVGLGILIINSVASVSTILLYIGTALFLSLGLEPVVSWLTNLGMRRWLAVLLTILGVLALFAGIVLMILPVIVQQVSQLVQQISDVVANRDLLHELQDWLKATFPLLDVSVIFGEAQKWLLDNLGTFTQQVIGFSIALATGLFGAFIVLVLTIYFTASTPALKTAVYQLVPASRRDRFADLGEQITDSVGHFVIGQATLGAINGVASAIFLSLIGAPYPAVLAVVAFFFSLIPLVGTLTGSTIIVLICLIPGISSPLTALVAGIYYLVYMQIEAYFISPRVMSRAVSVPAAVVVIAALTGGALLNLLGALIAIPVAASILIIYRQVLIPRQNER